MCKYIILYNVKSMNILPYLSSHGGISSEKNSQMCLNHILWENTSTDLSRWGVVDVSFFPNHAKNEKVQFKKSMKTPQK